MIDKKIALALILALAVESAGVFAWAGATGERLKDVELGVARRVGLAERIARLEAPLDLANVQLIRIEQKLDR